jgi:hypothetical protein
VSGSHLRPAANFFFSLGFSLDSCGFVIFVAPSLTRGQVCNLLLLLVLASADLNSIERLQKLQNYISDQYCKMLIKLTDFRISLYYIVYVNPNHGRQDLVDVNILVYVS